MTDLLAKLKELRAKETSIKAQLTTNKREITKETKRLRGELIAMAPQEPALRELLHSHDVVRRVIEKLNVSIILLFMPDGKDWSHRISGGFSDRMMALDLLNRLKGAWAGMVEVIIEDYENSQKDWVVKVKCALMDTPPDES